MNYQVIDNFLQEENFLNLKNTLFPSDISNPSNSFAWNYQKGIVRDPDLGPTGYEEYDWMYVHSLKSSDFNKVSKYFYICTPIFERLEHKTILDVRANLLVTTPKHIHHEDHVDRQTPHKVAIFYVTTNNGYTILENVGRIDCVENRLLIFDGSISHHSVTSTDEVRSVININYV